MIQRENPADSKSPVPSPSLGLFQPCPAIDERVCGSSSFQKEHSRVVRDKLSPPRFPEGSCQLKLIWASLLVYSWKRVSQLFCGAGFCPRVQRESITVKNRAVRFRIRAYSALVQLETEQSVRLLGLDGL